MGVKLNSKSFNILSLSGGGCRGIFQAVYLRKLEEAIGEPLWKKFDLISGTSTGAIVALALSLEISPKRIEDLYRNKSATIFTPKTFMNSEKLAGFRKGPIYNHQLLRESLKEVFETKQLRDSKTSVLITASCLDEFSHRIFTSYRDINPSDQNLSVVDVALASSAAPTYFAPVQPVSKQTSYLDGGLWANSPSLVSLLFVNNFLRIPIESIKILSIGTGDFNKGLLSNDFINFRKYSVRTVKTLYEIMFAAQESSDYFQVKMLLGDDQFIKISTNLNEFIPLDDAGNSIAKLPAKAEIQADETISRVMPFLNSNIKTTICRRHKLKCPKNNDLLISDQLIEATGLTAFYPSRKYYKYRKGAESIDSYINTAKKSVIMVSINLMTGVPFDGVCDCLKKKLENSENNFSAIISLLNPEKSNLIFSISPALPETQEELSNSINSTLERLIKLRESLQTNAKQRFDIRVHEALPFGSAIIIDHEEDFGRIQIETKPYKAKLNESFAFEVCPFGDSIFFNSLVTGYMKLIEDGQSIIS